LSEQRRICAVLFDFDGTLATLSIDFPLMRTRVLAAMQKMGIPISLLKSRYVLETIEEGAALLKDGNSEGLLRERARKIMEKVEMDAVPKASLFPWVAKTASDLAADGIKAGIVTRNCRRAVTAVLGPAAALFQALVTRDETRTVKPNPSHLWQALSLLGNGATEPKRAIMVGDHPMDMKGAKQAGMYALGVMTGAGDKESLESEGADSVCPDGSHVPNLIRTLNGADRLPVTG